MNFICRIFGKLRQNLNPIKYWRKRGAQIGEGCEIYRSVSIDSEPYLVKIGNHVRINSGTHLITHDGATWVIRGYKKIFEDVDLMNTIVIGDNVSIGTNALIMPGVTIGNNSIVGAGAVVTHNIPEKSIVAGVPARIICTLDEYFEKHSSDFVHTKNMNKKDKEKFLKDKYLK